MVEILSNEKAFFPAFAFVGDELNPGDDVGLAVRELVGFPVLAFFFPDFALVRAPDGLAVVGTLVGANDGLEVGTLVGAKEGLAVVGTLVGANDGLTVVGANGLAVAGLAYFFILIGLGKSVNERMLN